MFMSTLGKGVNAFTMESLKGVFFFQINQIILIISQMFCFWYIIYKMLDKIFKLFVNEVFHLKEFI
jgi:hypothetical protein